MLINLIQILSGKSSGESLSFEIICDGSFLSEYGVDYCTPISVEAEISKQSGDELHIAQSYKCEMTFKCGRCLVPVKKSVENTIEKVIYLKKSGEEFDEDRAFLEGMNLNVEAIVMEDLIMNMPIQVLCSPNCKGLCVQCGIDLNENDCDCDNENLDPRLLELKKFFD